MKSSANAANSTSLRMRCLSSPHDVPSLFDFKVAFEEEVEEGLEQLPVSVAQTAFGSIDPSDELYVDIDSSRCPIGPE